MILVSPRDGEEGSYLPIGLYELKTHMIDHALHVLKCIWKEKYHEAHMEAHIDHPKLTENF